MNNRNQFRAVNWRRTALAAALSFGISGVALAQSTTGSLFGQAPAATGETVTAKSSSGVVRTVNVGADGRYALNGLPVGVYSVTLERDGQVVSTKNDVTVTVGTGREVSFAGAENAQNLEGLTVTANSLPTIDVTGVDSRTVITAQQLQKLPLARSSEAIALLAPGVVSGSGFFTGPTGNALVSFGGASVTENAYYINGMNVTDPLNGLGGINLPYGSIEQEEVLTGGYGAAYGRSDGGVINQVGKRGTNEWHFGGQVLWRPDSLSSDPRNIYTTNGTLYQYRNDNKATVTTESAYVGGPLIKDKLFMFASVEGQKTTDRLVGVKSASTTESSREFMNPSWYAKLDWNITDSNILELTGASTKNSFSANNYEHDNDTNARGDFINAATHTKQAANMWIAKYTGYITDNLTVSAQYGEQKTDLYTQLADNFDPNLDYIFTPNLQNPALAPAGGYSNNQTIATTTDPSHQTKGTNYRIDLTYVIGDHTITAGIDNQRTQDLNDGSYIPTNDGYAWNTISRTTLMQTSATVRWMRQVTTRVAKPAITSRSIASSRQHPSRWSNAPSISRTPGRSAIAGWSSWVFEMTSSPTTTATESRISVRPPRSGLPVWASAGT